MRLFCTLLLGVVASALVLTSQDIKDLIHSAHLKCQEDPSTAITDEELEAFKKNPAKRPVNVAAHSLCASKVLGWLDSEGKVNTEAIKGKIGVALKDPTQLDDVVKECAVDKTSPEESAGHFFRCFYKHATITL